MSPADRDPLGRSALHYAALRNDVDGVRAALAAGEGIDQPEGRSGYTPLHLAVQDGALQAATILLDAGANLEATTDLGERPLHLSVMNWRNSEDGSLIRLLLDRGADRTALDNSGYTAADLARGQFQFPAGLSALLAG